MDIPPTTTVTALKEIPPPRAQWDNGLQFILTCIGYAVGLGNIWRFPSLAYEHGGGAFLVPYLICSFVVGFPLLYLEMSLGQLAKCGPAVVHSRIRPLFQGVGWTMATISLMVATYYNIIVSWVLIYLWIIVTGRSGEWASCRNPFNSPYCSSSLEDARCALELGGTNSSQWAFFFNGTCHYGASEGAKEQQHRLFSDLPAVSPAEEFFEQFVLEKTPTMDSLGGLNAKIVVALATAWIITALVLVKGVEMIGKISSFTATFPYLIIVILFVRGITLDGASIGLRFYLLEPDMSFIFDPETWRAAATHVCYSLAIGFGGLLSLSSFNTHTHNCYKDAAIIVVADGFMSIFGGTAVFSVLGFMAKQLDAPISTVVQSGTGLAFIAYPEAMSRMPLSWLWSLLFFCMLFILGISSQFGLAEVMCTAVQDQFPSIRKHKSWLAIGVCSVLFGCGLIMTTRAGIFYFNIFNDYSASFSLMLLIILELLLIVYIYGLDEYVLDLRSMMGTPRTWLGKVFGPSGSYLQFIWKYIAPAQSVVIFFVTLNIQLANKMTYGKDKRLYVYPEWSIVVGWVITLVPLLMLPLMVLYNLAKFKRQGRSYKELFRLQPKWTTYGRHQLNRRRERANDTNHLNSIAPLDVGNEAVPPNGWMENKEGDPTANPAVAAAIFHRRQSNNNHVEL